jgi:hypothetical protein
MKLFKRLPPNFSSIQGRAFGQLILEILRKVKTYRDNVNESRDKKYYDRKDREHYLTLKKSKDRKRFKAYLKRRDYKPPFIPAPKDYYITLLSKLPKHIRNKIIDELLVLGRTFARYRKNPRKLKFFNRDFNIWVNKILDYKNSKKKDLATLTEEEIQKESKFNDKT